MVKRSIYFVLTANADTGLGNRDRICDVLGEVIAAVWGITADMNLKTCLCKEVKSKCEVYLETEVTMGEMKL